MPADALSFGASAHVQQGTSERGSCTCLRLGDGDSSGTSRHPSKEHAVTH